MSSEATDVPAENPVSTRAGDVPRHLAGRLVRAVLRRLAPNIAHLQQRIADLYGHSERIDKRLLVHDQHLAELDAARAEIGRVDQRLLAHDEQLKGISSLQTDIGRIDKRLLTHDEQFKEISSLRTDISRIDRRLLTHDQQFKEISSLRTDISRIDQRLLAHDAEGVEARGRLETLQRRLQVVVRHVQAGRRPQPAASDPAIALPTRKIRVADNTPLSDSEFERCRGLRTVLSALSRHEQANSPEGGIAWSEIAQNPSYQLDELPAGNDTPR